MKGPQGPFLFFADFSETLGIVSAFAQLEPFL